MKFTCSVTVDQPPQLVAKLFADPDKLVHYQEGFLRKELVSGDPGHDGAVSKMFYRMGKREMELTETIVRNELPDRFLARYHHQHMDNTMEARFSAIGNSRTRYEAIIEYTEFRGLLPKLMGMFGKAMFKKQTQRWLNNFKRYAESLRF